MTTKGFPYTGLDITTGGTVVSGSPKDYPIQEYTSASLGGKSHKIYRKGKFVGIFSEEELLNGLHKEL